MGSLRKGLLALSASGLNGQMQDNIVIKKNMLME